jgi:hypothetical protein
METDGGLIMDITHFGKDIAIEGFHHFKVVNWVGFNMSWEESVKEKEAN